MNTLYVQDSVDTYFNELIILVNNQYGVLKDIIWKELKSNSTSLFFEYNPTISLNKKEFVIMPSGSGYNTGFDVIEAGKYLFGSTKKQWI